ncbi:protein NEN4-like [Aristolochia californica]|uniref:protein NEN4-like n=1 Tax=Aristolochia californica TaxID=171875 RepID=UPI0035E32DAA
MLAFSQQTKDSALENGNGKGTVINHEKLRTQRINAFPQLIHTLKNYENEKSIKPGYPFQGLFLPYNCSSFLLASSSALIMRTTETVLFHSQSKGWKRMQSWDSEMEIVFFDMETTVPARSSGEKRFWVLEFGAILVCPRKLIEVDSFATLIRPGDLSAVPLSSPRCEGITANAVADAPTFEEVADRIFSILNGRIWAGHNIQRFDSARIREAFADIGRPAPEPLGMIDSLDILNRRFGRRAGDLKMATLAAYFGLGRQKHRSLDDVRMNLEVIKHCATVLLLESSLPDHVLARRGSGSSSIVTRSKTNGTLCQEDATRKSLSASSPGYQRALPYAKPKPRKMKERGRSSLVVCQ